MKAIVSSVVIGLIAFAIYSYGYWEGSHRAQERAVIMGATAGVTHCVAQNLVEMRQYQRLIEARNRKPIVVECRP